MQVSKWLSLSRVFGKHSCSFSRKGIIKRFEISLSPQNARNLWAIMALQRRDSGDTNAKKFKLSYHFWQVVERIYRNMICIDAVRDAATEFIVRDIRPFYALEGEGLQNLLKTMIHVGKKYPRLALDYIKRLIPSRFTMRRHTDKKTIDAIKMIKTDLAKSIQSVGGFSCTLDLYSHRYRCNTYLCITARLNII